MEVILIVLLAVASLFADSKKKDTRSRRKTKSDSYDIYKDMNKNLGSKNLIKDKNSKSSNLDADIDDFVNMFRSSFGIKTSNPEVKIEEMKSKTIDINDPIYHSSESTVRGRDYQQEELTAKDEVFKTKEALIREIEEIKRNKSDKSRMEWDEQPSKKQMDLKLLEIEKLDHADEPERLERLSQLFAIDDGKHITVKELRKAIVMSEVLDKPISMRKNR
ncbi:MAG: hypothetical protein GXZ08_08095 [Tissierellia bacterium]|nr:hypothetical protein [Tissierellia bacterium]